jgi:hypothetical protein
LRGAISFACSSTTTTNSPNKTTDVSSSGHTLTGGWVHNGYYKGGIKIQQAGDSIFGKYVSAPPFTMDQDSGNFAGHIDKDSVFYKWILYENHNINPSVFYVRGLIKQHDSVIDGRFWGEGDTPGRNYSYWKKTF